MSDPYNLERFVNAQKTSYDTALSEIREGQKRSHWMWYIFPQFDGLGFSSMTQHYAIKDLQEASEYLSHPVLGKRLVHISNALLSLPSNDAKAILGSPDDSKLRSSMTLFTLIPGTDPVFQKVLDKYFNGVRDPGTLTMLHDHKG